MLRFGYEPYLECSSKGDKRFSAFYARLRKFNNATIEEVFQGAKLFEDGRTGLTVKEAKGKKAVNQDYVNQLYSELWDIYFDENPHLKDFIIKQSGFSDIFGQKGHCCQAEEIYRIMLNIKEKLK